MVDAHYTHPRLVALYDLDSPWSEDRSFYLNLAGDDPKDVLEIGAGTGIVSRAMATAGHRVAAVDPAAEMIAFGRAQPGGDRIDWHVSTATDLSLGRQFDLIFMTGNVFQVFATPDEAEAAIRTAYAHLKPGRLLAFETRNPALDWASEWQRTYVLETPDGPVRHSRDVLETGPGYIRFATRYDFGDEELLSESRLQFLTRLEVEAMLERLGFTKTRCFGDWAYGSFDPATSRPMVFLAEKAV